MQSFVAALFGTEGESRDYAPLLKWILVNALAAFGVLVLLYFGLLQEMLNTDPTRMALVVIGVFVLAAIHCLVQTVIVSRELIVARKVRDAIVTSTRGRPLRMVDDKIITPDGTVLEPGIITNHIHNLFEKARNLGGTRLDQTLLLRSLADRLRSREKLGLFIAEALLRLALLGTAIGFILMLLPISALDTFDATSLQPTLAGMTAGMAIALNVTVAGLATALLLKFEYYLLDEAIADLFHTITEVSEVHVVPALERAGAVNRTNWVPTESVAIADDTPAGVQMAQGTASADTAASARTARSRSKQVDNGSE